MNGMKKRERRLAKELEPILECDRIPLVLRTPTHNEKRRNGTAKANYKVRLFNPLTKESVANFGKAYINDTGSITIRLRGELSDRLKLTDRIWLMHLIPLHGDE